MTTRGIPVVVNHGRWIVSCPFCKSAELGRPDQPFFLCGGCQNTALEGRPIPVEWPHNYLEIDAVLFDRPEIVTRNWTPTETLNDLQRENAYHGL